MTLGDVIKEYRINNNMTMEDIAKISGLSKGYISMLEKNENPRTKKPIVPSLETIRQIATALNINFNEIISLIDQTISLDDNSKSETLVLPPEYFELIIKGRSMEPRIYEGDSVIVHRQSDVDDGSIAVVRIKGKKVSVKKISKKEDGILLIGLNVSAYTPKFYSYEDIEILGEVVEVRSEVKNWK